MLSTVLRMPQRFLTAREVLPEHVRNPVPKSAAFRTVQKIILDQKTAGHDAAYRAGQSAAYALSHLQSTLSTPVHLRTHRFTLPVRIRTERHPDGDPVQISKVTSSIITVLKALKDAKEITQEELLKTMLKTMYTGNDREALVIYERFKNGDLQAAQIVKAVMIQVEVICSNEQIISEVACYTEHPYIEDLASTSTTAAGKLSAQDAYAIGQNLTVLRNLSLEIYETASRITGDTRAADGAAALRDLPTTSAKLADVEAAAEKDGLFIHGTSSSWNPDIETQIQARQTGFFFTPSSREATGYATQVLGSRERPEDAMLAGDGRLLLVALDHTAVKVNDARAQYLPEHEHAIVVGKHDLYDVVTPPGTLDVLQRLTVDQAK